VRDPCALRFLGGFGLSLCGCGHKGDQRISDCALDRVFSGVVESAFNHTRGRGQPRASRNSPGVARYFYFVLNEEIIIVDRDDRIVPVLTV
jgi:hypothetical protein